MKATVVNENRANGLFVCNLQTGNLSRNLILDLLANLVLALDLDDANRLARLDQQVDLTASAAASYGES